MQTKSKPTYTTDELIEIEKCKSDFLYFLDNYVYIIDRKTHSKIKFKLWEKRARGFLSQRGAAEQLPKHRFIQILKGRQLGFSWLLAAYAAWRTIFNDYVGVVIISKRESDAKDFLTNKVKFIYNNLPAYFKKQPIFKTNDTLLHLGIENPDASCGGQNSFIKSIPTSPDAGRQESLSILILDEYAFCEHDQTIYTAAINTLSTSGGQMILLSTANGMNNMFAETWNGDNDFYKMFLPWDSNPDRDEKWYEAEERNQKDKALFRQEHPSTPDEAFILSGTPAFNMEILTRKIKELIDRPPSTETGNLFQGYDGVKFAKVDGGSYTIWEQPTLYGSYAIGADVAEGHSGGDYSVAYVANVKNRKRVAVFYGHIDANAFGKELVKLGTYYNCAYIGVERNSVGAMTVYYLQNEAGYPNLYMEQVEDGSGSVVNRYGWYTSRTSKIVLINSLLREINENLCDTPDKHFWFQCSKISRKTEGGNTTYVTEGKAHDDRVIANAITSIMIDRKPPHAYQQDVKDAFDKLNESMMNRNKESTVNPYLGTEV